MEFKGKVMTVVFVIIGIVLLFSLVGNMAPTITDSATSISAANNCSEGKDNRNLALTYNASSGNCQNSTPSDLYTAGRYTIPLQGLFNSSGIVMIVFMVGILTTAIYFVFKKVKGK